MCPENPLNARTITMLHNIVWRCGTKHQPNKWPAERCVPAVSVERGERLLRRNVLDILHTHTHSSCIFFFVWIAGARQQHQTHVRCYLWHMCTLTHTLIWIYIKSLCDLIAISSGPECGEMSCCAILQFALCNRFARIVMDSMQKKWMCIWETHIIISGEMAKCNCVQKHNAELPTAGWMDMLCTDIVREIFNDGTPHPMR